MGDGSPQDWLEFAPQPPITLTRSRDARGRLEASIVLKRIPLMTHLAVGICFSCLGLLAVAAVGHLAIGRLLLAPDTVGRSALVDARSTLWFAATALAAVNGAFAALIVSQMRRALIGAVVAVESVAAGDLRVSLDSNNSDEFGRVARALRSMAVKLAGIVRSVQSNSEGLSGTANELAEANAQLDARTVDSVKKITSAAAGMRSLAEAIQLGADKAGEARQLATQSSSDAGHGEAAVKDVVSTMREIRTASQKVADINGVIDTIAFQTNLLALNAAVEAARAGEQGRGFAVVAEAVRALAGKCSASAAEIRVLLEAGSSLTVGGLEKAEGAAQCITRMRQSAGEAGVVLRDLAALAERQSELVRPVAEAMGDLESLTSSNAAMVKQTSVTSLSVLSRSRELAQTMQAFSP
jgi:methyl-accepting chemotaxis protein